MPTQTIPNWWKKVKLGEVATFEYWYTQSATEKEIWPKFLRITDISKENLDWESVPYCEISDFNFEKYKLKDWDIVVARTWATAWYWKYIKNPPKSVFAGYLIRINLNNNLVRNDYLWPLIESKIFKEFIKKHIQGAAQPQANVPVIKEFEFLLPPLPIQCKVASILSKYDELIENNNKRIKILEQMGKVIFDDMMKQAEEKGELEEVKVKEIIEKVPTWKKYSSKTVSKEWKVPVLDQWRSWIIGYHNDEPWIIVSPNNPIITFANHTCYQNLIMFPFSTIQNVFAFLPKDWLDIYWLFYATKGLISFYDYKGHFPEFLEKKTFISKNLNYSKIFWRIASKLHKEIYNLQLQNQNLKQTRDLLIPRLVNGKLDVREMKVNM